jgi:TPR repeat protein
MKANRLTWVILVLCVGTLLPSLAQESAADRKRLDEIKARADKGDAEALIELAALYSVGSGVPKDPVKAAKLHRKAAELGNARGECLLGLDYSDGLGVKKNMTEAVHWLGKAADKGLAGAQYDLAMCYSSGDIEGRSTVDAVVLFRKAADQGLPQAEAALGTCYLEGTGVPKSVPEGIKWTQKAAEQGNQGAQQTLGLCYTKGRGVATNNVLAYKWLALAAAKDNPNSDDVKVNLSLVERLMTPEQIAEGQRLAGEFVPSKGDARPATAGPASASQGGASVAASSARTGLVNVKADDETQEIYVDGAFVGNTPAKLKLAEGPHVIEVKKAGFKDYRKQVQVGEGSELTLRVNLDKE